MPWMRLDSDGNEIGAYDGSQGEPRIMEQQKDPDESSAAETFGREAIHAAPEAVGIVGAGALAAPLLHSTAVAVSAFATPVAGAAVEIIGGLGLAALASYSVGKAKDLGLEAIMGEDKFNAYQEMRAKGASAHPWAAFTGGIAGSAPSFGLSVRNPLKAGAFAMNVLKQGKKATIETLGGEVAFNTELQNMLNVSLGSGTMAYQEARKQVDEGEFRPFMLAANLVGGMVLSNPEWHREIRGMPDHFESAQKMDAVLNATKSFQTPEGLQETTSRLIDELRKEKAKPKGPVEAFLSKVFGSEQGTTVQELLNKDTLRGIQLRFNSLEDTPETADIIKDHIKNRIGVQEVKDDATAKEMTERVQKNPEKFHGWETKTGYRVFTSDKTFFDDADLAEKSNLGLQTDIKDIADVVSGKLEPQHIEKLEDFQKIFTNITDPDEARDMRATLKGLSDTTDFKDTFFLGPDTLIRGTREEFRNPPKTADGKPVMDAYGISDNLSPNKDGNFYMRLKARSVDGKIVLTREARLTDLAEDSLEHVYKKINGTNLSPVLKDYIASSRRTLLKLRRTETDPLILDRVNAILKYGEFERSIKSILYNNFGYHPTDVGNALFGDLKSLGIEPPQEVINELMGMIDPKVLQMLDKGRATFIPKPGPEQQWIVSSMQAPRAGDADLFRDKALHLLEEHAGDRYFHDLNELAKKPMNVKANREAVVKHIADGLKAHRTFSGDLGETVRQVSLRSQEYEVQQMMNASRTSGAKSVRKINEQRLASKRALQKLDQQAKKFQELKQYFDSPYSILAVPEYMQTYLADIEEQFNPTLWMSKQTIELSKWIGQQRADQWKLPEEGGKFYDPSKPKENLKKKYDVSAEIRNEIGETENMMPAQETPEYAKRIYEPENVWRFIQPWHKDIAVGTMKEFAEGFGDAMEMMPKAREQWYAKIARQYVQEANDTIASRQLSRPILKKLFGIEVPSTKYEEPQPSLGLLMTKNTIKRWDPVTKKPREIPQFSFFVDPDYEKDPSRFKWAKTSQYNKAIQMAERNGREKSVIESMKDKLYAYNQAKIVRTPYKKTFAIPIEEDLMRDFEGMEYNFKEASRKTVAGERYFDIGGKKRPVTEAGVFPEGLKRDLGTARALQERGEVEPIETETTEEAEDPEDISELHARESQTKIEKRNSDLEVNAGIKDVTYAETENPDLNRPGGNLPQLDISKFKEVLPDVDWGKQIEELYMLGDSQAADMRFQLKEALTGLKNVFDFTANRIEVSDREVMSEIDPDSINKDWGWMDDASDKDVTRAANELRHSENKEKRKLWYREFNRKKYMHEEDMWHGLFRDEESLQGVINVFDGLTDMQHALASMRLNEIANRGVYVSAMLDRSRGGDLNFDAMLHKLNSQFESTDFINRFGYGTPRLAQFFIHADRLREMQKLTGDAQLKAQRELSMEIHDWAVRNNITKLGIHFRDMMGEKGTVTAKAPDAIEQPKMQGTVPFKLIASQKLKSYKGIPLVYKTDMKHARLGHPIGASMRTDAEGGKTINLDPEQLQKSFDVKQWTKPRVPGVKPLPEDFFKTVDEFVSYTLEHEYQHTVHPKPKTETTMPADQFAAYEMSVDDAALKALGRPTRSGVEEKPAERIPETTKSAEIPATSVEAPKDIVGIKPDWHPVFRQALLDAMGGRSIGMGKYRSQALDVTRPLSEAEKVSPTVTESEVKGARYAEPIDELPNAGTRIVRYMRELGNITGKLNNVQWERIHDFARPDGNTSLQDLRLSLPKMPEERLFNIAEKAVDVYNEYFTAKTPEAKTGKALVTPFEDATWEEMLDKDLATHSITPEDVHKIMSLDPENDDHVEGLKRLVLAAESEMKNRVQTSFNRGSGFANQTIELDKQFGRLMDLQHGLYSKNNFQRRMAFEEIQELLVQYLTSKQLGPTFTESTTSLQVGEGLNKIKIMRDSLGPDFSKLTDQQVDRLHSLVASGQASINDLRTHFPELTDAERMAMQYKAKRAFAGTLDRKNDDPDARADALKTEEGVKLEQQELDFNNSNSMTIADDLKEMAPWMYNGVAGLHMKFLEGIRAMRVAQNNDTIFYNSLLAKAGLSPKSTWFRQMSSEQKGVANRMFEAIGAKLEGSNLVVRKLGRTIGELEHDAYEKYRLAKEAGGDTHPAYLELQDKLNEYKEWRKQGYRREPALGDNADELIKNWNSMKLPGQWTAEQFMDDIRSAYNRNREQANKDVAHLKQGEWIKYLIDYINHNYRRPGDMPEPEYQGIIKNFVEESSRSKQRRIPTYEDAARRGLMPITQDAAQLFKMWGEKVWKNRMRTTFLNTAAVIKNIDGSPSVVVEDNPAFKGDRIMSPETLRQMKMNIKEFVNEYNDMHTDPSTSRLTLNEDGFLPASQMKELGYVEMAAPFDSIERFWTMPKREGENVMKMLLDRKLEWRPFGGADWLNAITTFNGWSKQALLFGSGFHPFSLMENYLSYYGLSLKNPLFHPLQFYKDSKAMFDRYNNDPQLNADWLGAGLMIGHEDPNIDQGKLDKGAQGVIDRLKESDSMWARGTGKVTQKVFNFKKMWDNYLWNKMHPTLKLMMAEDAYQKAIESAKVQGITVDDKQLRQNIASLANKTLGGLEMERYMWATPHARQLLHSLMFAPDWTISVAEASGMTQLPGLKQMMATEMSGPEAKILAKKYWPAMAGMFLFGLPNAIQAAIYGIWGKPEEGDKMFNFQNETGKQTSIDTTPMLRHLTGIPIIGYEGGDTGKRRVYMRWGKQAYEVAGWFSDPIHTALNKSSMAVHTVYEQVTGTSTSGYAMPFAKDGLLGLINHDGSFMDSRSGYVAQKVMPMWILNALTDKPYSWIATASRGAALGTTLNQMTDVLHTYANRGTAAQLKGYPNVTGRLDKLMEDIIQAGLVNGVDVSEAMDRATTSVLTHSYLEFFKALQKNDPKEMEAQAEAVLRLNKGIKNAMNSMKKRYEVSGKRFGQEEADQVMQAFRSAGEKIKPNPEEVAALQKFKAQIKAKQKGRQSDE